MFSKLLFFATLTAVCLAQDYDEYQPSVRQQSGGASRYNSPQQEEPKQEPIAILKQINKHNEDGSYTYGYEGADGSFKIETKAANGDVKGKYGYVDGDGKVRTVEYGADKYGFQPSGEGITVAPIDYSAVKEADYEEEQQRYAPQPKQVQKAPRPQTFNNYSPAMIEKRRPIYDSSPAPPQYYDYEEEAPATQRPVQFARPKYAVQAPQQRPQPATQTQYSSVTDFDFTYGQEQRAVRPNTQYQQIDTRQPVQFPPEPAASPVPSLANRAEQFSLFSPAAERADTFKSKFEQFAQQPLQYAPQTQPQPQQPPQLTYQRPAFASKPASARATSVLDQLAKDPNYALPQSSPALHDISFGYSL